MKAKAARKKFPDAPAPQLPPNISSSSEATPQTTKDKILLKVKIPTKDTVKTISFSSNNTTEEALAIISKKLQLQQEEIKSNDFGLFIPAKGTWLDKGKPMSFYELQDMVWSSISWFT